MSISRKSSKKHLATSSPEFEDVHKQDLKMEKRMALKWNLAIACMALRFLLDGVEYAIVLPTLYGFLLKMEVEIEFIGIIVASYALGGFLAGPIMGRVADQFGIGKLVICFGCCLSIIGNFIYFIAQNKWYLAIARFFCGMSSGVEPVILGEIGKNEYVKPSKRASLFSMLLGTRQAGMLLGPLFVILFEKVQFTLGGFDVDKSNLGGIFCSCMFGICLALFVLFFDLNNPVALGDDSDELSVSMLENQRDQAVASGKPNLDESTFENEPLPGPEDHLIRRNITKIDAVSVPSYKSSPEGSPRRRTLDSNNPLNSKMELLAMNEDDEITRERKNTLTLGAVRDLGEAAVNKFGSGLNLMAAHNPMGPQAPSQITADWNIQPNNENNRSDETQKGSFKDLLTEPLIIGLFGTYAIFVQQATVETVMTPTTDMILGWKETENALMLVAVGFELLIAFLTVGPISKRINDTGVLLLGTGCITIIVVLICLYAPYAAREVWWLMPVFVLSVAGFVFFMPYIVIGTAALLSRSVPPEQQATVQGLRTACERFGQILGPLLAGHSLNWNLIWVFLPPGLHIFLVFAMCYFSQKALSQEALDKYANGSYIRKLYQRQATKSK